MAQKLVRVIGGTGSVGLQQVNITGASGSWPQWVQHTAIESSTGPTGRYQTVQAINTGPSGGHSIKTVQIVGYVGPA